VTAPSRARRRAGRLLRWYPAEWRARYGDEFRELLAADLAERPRSWTGVDVAFGGIMARIAGMGLVGSPVNPSDRSRRCLATFGCALAVLLTFAISMWSQLDIAQRWTNPTTRVTHQAIDVMTVAVAVCVIATAVVAIPVAWTSVLTAARQPELGLRRPVGVFFSAAAVVVAGGVLFRHGWPGMQPWSHHASGPGGVVAFLWASTIAVSAYWAHPSILLSLPPIEIAWMVVSPVAVALTAAGAALTLRRIDLPARLLRFVGVTARVAILGFALFMSGTLTWLVDGSPGPGHTFQAGTVDLIGLAVMIVALTVAAKAVLRASPSSSLTGT
jgi:hypothetical protein